MRQQGRPNPQDRIAYEAWRSGDAVTDGESGDSFDEGASYNNQEDDDPYLEPSGYSPLLESLIGDEV